MSELSISQLVVTYAGKDGGFTALRDLSLTVREGGLTVLLGQSGCGKSTALNAIAGLTTPASGQISLGARQLFSRASGAKRLKNVPPDKREIGVVFQSYALWPHLSAVDNVAYPLRRRGMNRRDARRSAMPALEMVQCQHLADRYPAELSGGQQQRVALARAVVGQPRLLLFDEPLSNLDASLRKSLRDELARLHRDLGFTAVYVTHDQSEALALADEVALMDAGQIVQLGTPQQVYERPDSPFAARFFGSNVLLGEVVACGSAGCHVSTSIGQFESETAVRLGPVVVAIQPHALSLQVSDREDARVESAVFLGSAWEYRIRSRAGEECVVLEPGLAPRLSVGQGVIAVADQSLVRVFPDDEARSGSRPIAVEEPSGV